MEIDLGNFMAPRLGWHPCFISVIGWINYCCLESCVEKDPGAIFRLHGKEPLWLINNVSVMVTGMGNIDDIPGVCPLCWGWKEQPDCGKGVHHRFQWVTGEGCGVPSTVPQHDSVFLAPPIPCPSKPQCLLFDWHFPFAQQVGFWTSSVTVRQESSGLLCIDLFNTEILRFILNSLVQGERINLHMIK